MAISNCLFLPNSENLREDFQFGVYLQSLKNPLTHATTHSQDRYVQFMTLKIILRIN